MVKVVGRRSRAGEEAVPDACTGRVEGEGTVRAITLPPTLPNDRGGSIYVFLVHVAHALLLVHLLQNARRATSTAAAAAAAGRRRYIRR
jgi:hypothetical protein